MVTIIPEAILSARVSGAELLQQQVYSDKGKLNLFIIHFLPNQGKQLIQRHQLPF